MPPRRPLHFHPPHESDLLARWQAGDSLAGRSLVRRQVEPLRCFFRPRVPCSADAEDLVQHTLAASIDALPRFRGEGSFAGYVRGIANRLLLRHRRDGERARMRLATDLRPDSFVSDDSSPLVRISREDSSNSLQRALDELPEANRRLLWLRYWEGRSTVDIGRLVGLQPGAVRARLYRARRELRDALVRVSTEAKASTSDVWPIRCR